MAWIYIAFVVIVLIIIFMLIKNKGGNNDVNLSPKEKDMLNEDYISHGTRKNIEDEKNI